MTPHASRLALAALAVLLGACATQRTERGAQWKIEPVLAVRHSAAAAEAHYRLGRYHEGMQRWGDALDEYRRASAADPGHVDAWNALGVAYARVGQLDRAEPVLRRALALAPARADLRSNLGHVLALAGKPAEAVAELRTALAQDPDNGVTRENLRLALQQVEPASVQPRAATVAAVQKAAQLPEATEAAIRPLQVIDTPTLAAWAERPPSATPPDRPAAAAAPDGPAPAAAPGRLEISNGMGAAGAAERLRRWLVHQGVATQRLSNTRPYTQPATVVQFGDGHALAAERVARLLPMPVAVVRVAGLQADVRVLLGRDWKRLAACLDAGCAAPALQFARAADAR